jgi:hypothetical protein
MSYSPNAEDVLTVQKEIATENGVGLNAPAQYDDVISFSSEVASSVSSQSEYRSQLKRKIYKNLSTSLS